MTDPDARRKWVRDTVLAQFHTAAPTLVRDLWSEAASAGGHRPSRVLAILHDLAPDYHRRWTREAAARWDDEHPCPKETTGCAR